MWHRESDNFFQKVNRSNVYSDTNIDIYNLLQTEDKPKC